jgi:uncharacterized SAM-binding protein YcdF (DUF218 family)
MAADRHCRRFIWEPMLIRCCHAGFLFLPVSMLETKIPKDIDLSAAQAIVVLGSDLRANDTATPESLGPQTLERLFFAVDAYKQLRLPIAVSGGPISNPGTPIAEMMRSALERYFEIPVTWTESKSQTTFENATFTTRLLQNMNIRTVIVATQAPRRAPGDLEF